MAASVVPRLARRLQRKAGHADRRLSGSSRLVHSTPGSMHAPGKPDLSAAERRGQEQFNGEDPCALLRIARTAYQIYRRQFVCLGSTVSLSIISGAARPRRFNRLPHLKVKPPQNLRAAMAAFDPAFSNCPRCRFHRLLRGKADASRRQRLFRHAPKRPESLGA